jgi:putative N6-adenine-specific DNA methylase
MQDFNTKGRVIITCNKRLSPYIQQEVEALGFQVVQHFATYVEVRGSLADCIRLNLNLRCASQVLYSLQSFVANSPDDVYRELNTIPWEEIIPAGGYFSVTGNVDHPTITNSLFANVRVKDAIVDRMRNQSGTRPNTGPSLEQTVIHLFWRNETAEIFIDTSGETLAKHGYRKIPGKAPMLEALAAATIMATRWNRASPFVNPMCGSSTLAIEAALLATNRAPGLFRSNYAFMHIKGFTDELYKTERDKLESNIVDQPGLTIIATDISEDAINISRINAAAAGVDHIIDFAGCDFEETEIPQEEGGVIFFNPEYGERLGEEVQLQETYARIGDFMKNNCKGYTGYVFTGNLDLAKKIGLKAKRRIEFYTSKIDCRLLEYELYAGTRRPPEAV